MSYYSNDGKKKKKNHICIDILLMQIPRHGLAVTYAEGKYTINR